MTRLRKFVRAWPFLACVLAVLGVVHGANLTYRAWMLKPVRADVERLERKVHTLEQDVRTIYGWLAEIETEMEGE